MCSYHVQISFLELWSGRVPFFSPGPKQMLSHSVCMLTLADPPHATALLFNEHD